MSLNRAILDRCVHVTDQFESPGTLASGRPEWGAPPPIDAVCPSEFAIRFVIRTQIGASVRYPR
jgi:hypothetical protein